MENTIFGSECGLGEIVVTVLHSFTNEIGFGVCIHHSMTAVVVEVMSYDVDIAATEVPCLACVDLVMN